MYSHIVVFLHVLSAFVWVGGMIAIRVAVHPVLQSIEDHPIRLGKTLEVTGRLFHLVIPFILTLLVTGLIMVLDTDGHGGHNKVLYLSKEIIWSLMALNFIYMYIKRAKGWKLFGSQEYKSAREIVRYIPNILLPVNIALGILALWIGVSLRGL